MTRRGARSELPCQLAYNIYTWPLEKEAMFLLHVVMIIMFLSAMIFVFYFFRPAQRLIHLFWVFTLFPFLIAHFLTSVVPIIPSAESLMRALSKSIGTAQNTLLFPILRVFFALN